MGVTCGNSPAKCFNTFVIIDLVLAILGTLVSLVMLVGFFIVVSHDPSFVIESFKEFESRSEEIDQKNVSKTEKTSTYSIPFLQVSIIIMIIALMVGFVIEVLLFYLARRGIRTNSYGDCRKWFNIRIALLIICSSTIFFDLIDGELSARSWAFLLNCIYHIYKLSVANTFITSLKPVEVAVATELPNSEKCFV